MELLPILSTIILVGTIATLILAVAAYVLYKVRERQGRRPAAEPPPPPPSPLLLTSPAADPAQTAQLQELSRLAAAGLQQQRAAALSPAAEAPAWEAPAALFQEATFEDVTPLRPDGLAGFFASHPPLPTAEDEEAPDLPAQAETNGAEATEPEVAEPEEIDAAEAKATVSDGRAPAGTDWMEIAPAGRPVAFDARPGDGAPSGDGAPPERDARYEELMRLADELDELFDSTPPRASGDA